MNNRDNFQCITDVFTGIINLIFAVNDDRYSIQNFQYKITHSLIVTIWESLTINYTHRKNFMTIPNYTKYSNL